MSDSIAVMYLGKIIEVADSNMLMNKPKHPYTLSLISSVREIDPNQRIMFEVIGETANPIDPPSGCRYHPRCPYATDRCKAFDFFSKNIFL